MFVNEADFGPDSDSKSLTVGLEMREKAFPEWIILEFGGMKLESLAKLLRKSEAGNSFNWSETSWWTEHIFRNILVIFDILSDFHHLCYRLFISLQFPQQKCQIQDKAII